MTPTDDQILKMGCAILAMQPFSTLLGAELTAFTEGEAELTLPLREDHLQQHGFAHGGVVSYLADNALTFAGGSKLGDVLTVEYKINYQRPAKGVRLIARASVLSAGKRFATCTCSIFAADDAGAETLVATAQGTIAARK
ncbi:MAG: phenylacetic acid degradation protein [Rhodobacterales bacterium]|nr:MAG: phenylacetic acid degradation protein [Rhodobacterales bacterium]